MSSTFSLFLTRKWFEEQSNKTISTALTSKLNKIKTNTDLSTENLDVAKLYFDFALKHRENKNKFQKYIKLSYDTSWKVFKSNQIPHQYSKIFIYSLLISIGFIYHSLNNNNNYISGLKYIYNTLHIMNNDISLKNNLKSALNSIIFWTNSERNLIKSSIYFAIRTNILIKNIQKYISINIASNNNKLKYFGNDYDIDFIPKYLKNNWIPTYYDGYYFGYFGKYQSVFDVLCVSDFRNITDSDSDSDFIQVDDIIIHTNNIYESYLYINNNKRYVHHWYNGIDGGWFDFNELEPFKIYIRMLDNGKLHPLNVNVYDTILNIKREIFKLEGVPPAFQRLELNKKLLSDNYTLYDYKICKNSELTVFVLTSNPFLNIIYLYSQ